MTVSQVDQVLHDTLIHRAEGTAFDALTNMFGFPRPPSIDEAVWRHALRAVAYGHRGTLGTTWAAVELGLRSGSASRTVSVTLAASSPNTATFVSGSGDYASGFNSDWVGRLVRLRYHTGTSSYVSKVLYVQGPEQIADGAYSNTLTFADLATRLFTTEPCTSFTGTINASVELLSFTWREPSPGPVDAAPTAGAPLLASGDPTPVEWLSQPSFGVRCRIELQIEQSEFSVPPSYLLDPPGVDRSTFPGQPDGGIILDLFGAINDDTLVGTGDPLGDGPSPVYLIDDTSLQVLESYFDRILASGCDFEITVNDFNLYEGEGVSGELFAILFNFIAVGAVSDSRLSVDAGAPGDIQQQTEWPKQRAYVFEGGHLALTTAIEGPARLEWTYASGAQPGTSWTDPGTGEDLILETSTSASGPWTEVWRGYAGAAPGWVTEEHSIANGSTLYCRWRQVAHTSGDNWAIGSIRVWE